MKTTVRFITALLLIAVWPLCSGCNDEDDVMEILTGKTWKMTRLTFDKKNPPQFLPNLWNSKQEMSRSMDLLKQPNNFTVAFEKSETNGTVQESRITIQGIAAKAQGTWEADGKDNNLSLQLKVKGKESDPLAKEFIKGMQAVYKYEGDVHQLTLYYRIDQTSYKIGFVPTK